MLSSPVFHLAGHSILAFCPEFSSLNGIVLHKIDGV